MPHRTSRPVLLHRLFRQRAESKDSGAGDQSGKAQGIGAFFSKAANAVTNLMNLSTYFEMKQRAGTVGKNGVAPLIDELANQVEADSSCWAQLRRPSRYRGSCELHDQKTI